MTASPPLRDLLHVVGTVLMYLFEHDHRRSGFDDVGGALFWVSAHARGSLGAFFRARHIENMPAHPTGSAGTPPR